MTRPPARTAKARVRRVRRGVAAGAGATFLGALIAVAGLGKGAEATTTASSTAASSAAPAPVPPSPPSVSPADPVPADPGTQQAAQSDLPAVTSGQS